MLSLEHLYAAPAGGGPVGEIVRFVEENGQVVWMITGDSYVERVRQRSTAFDIEVAVP